MLIEEYLGGFFAIEVPKQTMTTILTKRGIAMSSELESISDKDKDLCLADLYMFASTLPLVKNNTEDSDGGWKHTEGGYQYSVTDRRSFRSMAKALYAKWGEKSSVNNIVIRVW